MAVSREVRLNYVVINGEQHIADTAVIRRINELEQDLCSEKKAHEENVKRLAADYETIAERILLNLNSGQSRSESCLAHSIDYYNRVGSDGNPIFDFKDEALRRIVLALHGKNCQGKDYK